MKIEINDNRKISAIQEDFAVEFPYLKLEFFSRPHKPGGVSPKRQLKSTDHTLGEFRSVHTTGEIEIIPQMTVSALEQQFWKLYGLGVQVFRKSGKIWLETTVTDNWTLEEQNRQGEELSVIRQDE